jgi:sugar phosphate isomerase/epimerase
MSREIDVSRRRFLKIGAAGVAGAALGAAGCSVFEGKKGGEAEAKKPIPIGLQLYSVRTECEKDLPKVIDAVGKMGYQGVEFAGYYGRSAGDLRKLLDGAGLKCCGTHIGLDELQGDKLAATVEFNKTLGNPYLIVAWIPDEKIATKAGCLEIAKTFDGIAAKVKPAGMRVGYHNHSSEFKPIDGGDDAWTLIFANTCPDVSMQVDTGNMIGGGGDPLAVLKRFPGRSGTIHLKESCQANPKALVGEGDIAWPKVFEICEGSGKTDWYVVEYESDAFPPLVAVEKCLANLKKMGKC